MSAKSKKVTHTFTPDPDVAALLKECDSRGITSAAVNECLRRYFGSQALEAIVNPTGQLVGLFKGPGGYQYRQAEWEGFQPLSLRAAAETAAQLLDQRPHDLETDLGILLRDLAKGLR